MAKFKKVVINIVSGCIWNREARHSVRKKLSEFQYSEYREFLRFKMGRVRKKSVLLMEFNPFHGEVSAGIIKYFHALGYNVDVAVNAYLLNEKPFCRLNRNTTQHNTTIRTYPIYASMQTRFMRTRHINKYDHVFLMTCTMSFGEKMQNLVPMLEKPGCNLYIVEHDTKRLSWHEKYVKSKRLVMLGKFPGTTFVNAHSFGDIKYNPKHPKTTFIVVGNIVPFRKNFDMLINAVTKLAREGLDFRVVCIGNGSLDNLPNDVRPFIETTGHLDFPDMFAQMENADFFLPLLDPTNTDHDRYITTGVTGSAQLIYGFAKVPLIHERFASFYRFDNSNAIIYDGDNLSEAMRDAISMSDADYEKIRNNLRRTTRQIWDESLGNLAGILKK